MARQNTRYYCYDCRFYLGTSWVPQCPSCGCVFDDEILIEERRRERASIYARPLVKTAIITAGIGGCTISSAITLSVTSSEWAAFFSSLATSIVWQFLITTIIFSVFFSVLKVLFWEKIDDLLAKHKRRNVYDALLKFRRFITPVARYKRMRTILLLIMASTLTLPIIAWKFNRPLDIYEIIINLLINFIGGLLIFLIDDVIK